MSSSSALKAKRQRIATSSNPVASTSRAKPYTSLPLVQRDLRRLRQRIDLERKSLAEQKATAEKDVETANQARKTVSDLEAELRMKQPKLYERLKVAKSSVGKTNREAARSKKLQEEKKERVSVLVLEELVLAEKARKLEEDESEQEKQEKKAALQLRVEGTWKMAHKVKKEVVEILSSDDESD